LTADSSSQTSATLFQLTQLLLVFTFPTILFIASVADSTLRLDILPRWLGWAGVLLACAELVRGAGAILTSSGPLVMDGAISFVIFLVFLLWVAAISVASVRRVGASSAVSPLASATAQAASA